MKRIIFLFFLIALQGCSQGYPAGRSDPVRPGQVRMSFREIDPGRAAPDAAAAIQRRNLGLIGVFGYSAMAPGFDYVDDEWPYGVLYVEGTSDYSRTPAEQAFNERAFAYAQAYNQRIIAAAHLPVPEQFCATRVEPPQQLDPARAPTLAEASFSRGLTHLYGMETELWQLPSARWDDAIALGCQTIKISASGAGPPDRARQDAVFLFIKAWNTEMLRLTARPPRSRSRPHWLG